MEAVIVIAIVIYAIYKINEEQKKELAKAAKKEENSKQKVAQYKSQNQQLKIEKAKKAYDAQERYSNTSKHLNNINPAQEKLASGNASDILVRANRNTKAYAKDTLHEQDCELHAESEGSLGKVEDLIVCGFQGTLNFDHDILGEAADMLLRMEKLPYEMDLMAFSQTKETNRLA